jgi:hypothetical protein
MVGAMNLDPNFREFIALLLEHDARFLIVGGYAVASTAIRATPRTSMFGYGFLRTTLTRY